MPDQSIPREYTVNHEMYSWTVDPNEIEIYKAQEVGDFTPGYVILSDYTEFGLWRVTDSYNMDYPQRYGKTRGLWVSRAEVDDHIVEHALEEPRTPNDTLTKFNE
jgi:hypothetical protein